MTKTHILHESGYNLEAALQASSSLPRVFVAIEALEDLFPGSILLVSITGLSRDDAEMVAAAQLDSARFLDRTDEILARHEGDEGLPVHFPDSDELLAQGVDIVALAVAMEAGLSAGAVGEFANIEDGLVRLSVALGDGLSAQGVEEALELGVEASFILDVLENHSTAEVNQVLTWGNRTVKG